MDTYLRLIPTCLLVKGIFRSAIYDIVRNDIFFIPSRFYDIFNSKYFKINLNDLSKEERQLFDELVTNELFLTSSSTSYFKQFPSLKKHWDHPSIISNAIIIYSRLYPIKDLITQLTELNCFHIQLLFTKKISLAELNKVFGLLEQSSLRTVEVVMKYDNKYNKAEVENLYLNNSRIRNIIFYNSSKTTFYFKKKKHTNVVCLSSDIDLNSGRSKVSPKYLNVNINLFLEGLKHHTYFNRKLFIDEDGNIKRNFIEQKTFGNVNTGTIRSAIKSLGYKKYWDVTKDNTSVCRDCELRYACIDHRVPKLSKQGTWYHEVDCTYNPYTMAWKL